MASSYTTNYNLDKYVGTDKPNLRDQYNAAMDKIDNALLAANTNATEAKAATQSFQGDLDAVSTAVSNEASARQSADTSLAGDIAANTTAITNEATARQSADTGLAGDIADNATAINNLSALLPAANFSSTDTVKKYVDDSIQIVQNEIDVINEQKYMVVIGDSFSSSAQSGTPLWYTYVADYYGLTPYSNAEDGVGFVEGSNTFMVQLNTAISAMAGKKVDRVYVLGGLNDTRSSSFNSETVRGAASALFTAIRNAWPNAKVAMYGPESFPEINVNNANLALWLSYLCSTNNIEYHDISAVFNLYNGFFGGKNGNNPHPSAQGQKQIAQYVISHGNIPFITWHPDFVPTNISPYTPTVGAVFAAAGSGTIGANVIKNQKLIRTGDRYIYEMVLDATQIPNTVTRLDITTPCNIAALLNKTYIDNLNYSDCYLSQLYANTVHTGWCGGSVTRGMLFNINGSTGITTGANTNDLRMTANIYRN